MNSKQKLFSAFSLVAIIGGGMGTAVAADDVKALLEILLEKGVITQDEYNNKIKKAADNQEIKEFNQSQDLRKINQEIQKKAEAERKFTTDIYGQVSAGYYSASNMTSTFSDVSGMSDQPKGNNRVGLRIGRELDTDVKALVTLESNFSSRTGAFGRDAGGYGYVAGGNPVFDREANFRLVSKERGTLILGRGPNLQTELSGAFDSRQNWNFAGLKPIGRYVGFHGAAGINRSDKMIRYISPVYEGFNFDGAVALGGNTQDEQKGTNYYFGGRYKKDQFEVGYNHIEARLSNSADVNNRADFIAAKYTVDKWTFNVGHVRNRNPSSATGGAFSTTATAGKVDADTIFGGAVYRIKSDLSWNLGIYSVNDKSASSGKNDLDMYATGLTWSPYKEWDFFIDYATVNRKKDATAGFTIFDKWVPDTATNGAGNSESKKSQSGVSVGALFRF
jgi:hypothetical protein